MKPKLLLALSLFVFSSFANAHPGHGLDGAYAGFMHPFTGWDHLLVMLAVGVWAAKLGGHARWQLPVTFVSIMGVGAGLGAAGFSFNGIESAIAASVMAMGLLLLISLPINLATRLGLTALFALFHGLAHGTELHFGTNLAGFGGMLLATALLHTLGLLLGANDALSMKRLQNALGWCMLTLGALWLIT